MSAAYSVEVAHLCAGMDDTGEPDASLTLLRSHLSRTMPGACSVVVLVDDTDGPGGTAAFRRLAMVRDAFANANMQSPDGILFESRLDAMAMDAVAKMPRRRMDDGRTALETSGITIVRSDGRPSCAMLAACWYLLRLGVMPQPEMVSGLIPSGKRCLSFLPRSLQQTEKRVDQLLHAMGHGSLCSAIERVYHPGISRCPSSAAPPDRGRTGRDKSFRATN